MRSSSLSNATNASTHTPLNLMSSSSVTVATITAGLRITTAYDSGGFGKFFLVDNARFISSVISKRRCDYESLEPSPKLRKLIESLPPFRLDLPSNMP